MVVETVTYSHECGNIVNTIKTSGHSSLEKYTPHFIRKGYCVKGELETEQRLQHIDPQLFRQYFFPILLGCSTGGLGAQPLPSLVLTPRTGTLTSNSDLQLIDFLLHLGYIIIWRPSASCGVTIHTQFNPSTVKDIFDRIHLLFTQVHFSSDSLAGSEVNMLHMLRNTKVGWV